ncbi:MAG: hypothetical protein C0519_15615 [Hyphomicrobium sp.]|jgi:hypothetical protein|nr:hypothetical protein [Hyphomicrobium sp.]MBY0225225.1 hypothetical protein [Hyphomicrobium sp.]
MIIRTITRAALALTLGFAAPALAHEAEKGPNGGALIDVEGHHIELVAAPDALTFYLTDDKEAPLDPNGAQMTAIVQEAGKTSQLKLVPVKPNKLTAATSAPVGSGAKVVITGSLPDGHKLQGRFVVP